MKQYLYLAAFAWIVVSSCKKDNPPPPYRGYYNQYDQYKYPSYYYPVLSQYPDTNRYAVPVAHQAVNGYTKFFYQNSPYLIAEGNYENGIPSGYWKFYYPDGKMMREGNYERGVLSGHWKFYYESGLKKEEGNYQNGAKSGNWKYYHPNGRIAAEINYN